MALLLGVDVVGGLICVGQRFVVVDLIAEVTFRVGEIVAIPPDVKIGTTIFSKKAKK